MTLQNVFRRIGTDWKHILQISLGFYFRWLYFLFLGEDISFFLYAPYPCVKEYLYYATKKQIHISQISFVIRYHTPTCFGRFCYHRQGVIHEYSVQIILRNVQQNALVTGSVVLCDYLFDVCIVEYHPDDGRSSGGNVSLNNIDKTDWAKRPTNKYIHAHNLILVKFLIRDLDTMSFRNVLSQSIP